jgi:hypothetical protein
MGAKVTKGAASALAGSRRCFRFAQAGLIAELLADGPRADLGRLL